MAQLMPLPLTVSCFSKIQIGLTFLVPAHLGIPGQSEVKRVCVYVCSCWALLRLASLCDRSALMYTVRQVHQSRRLLHLASDGLDGMMLSLIVEWTIITRIPELPHNRPRLQMLLELRWCNQRVFSESKHHMSSVHHRGAPKSSTRNTFRLVLHLCYHCCISQCN